MTLGSTLLLLLWGTDNRDTTFQNGNLVLGDSKAF